METEDNPMAVRLLDGSLVVEICYDEADSAYEDNICLTLYETCPDEEKIMIHDETHVFITSAQARMLAAFLSKAAGQSKAASKPVYHKAGTNPVGGDHG